MTNAKICILAILFVLSVIITFVNSGAIQQSREQKKAEELDSFDLGFDEYELEVDDNIFLFAPTVGKSCPEGQVWLADIKKCRKIRKHG